MLATLDPVDAPAEAKVMADSDGMLSVADLCRMFEEAEEASYEARQLAERDRDYYDNKQLTDAQIAVLRERGQPEVIINRIKRKIDYLVGLEKQQRTMPRSLPRTPQHEADAHAVTDALRFVADSEDYHSIRSAVWRNMLIEGAAAACVTVRQKPGRAGALGGPSRFAQQYALQESTALTPPASAIDYDVKIRFYAWDRFFADPHSSRLDYSDANYLGTVLWMDLVDAQAMYPDSVDILEGTLATGHYSDTYEDTPKWKVWSDRKRRRVRIVQIFVKRDDEWYFAEFTKGGILKSGPSPYVDEDGKTQCELVAQSAYVDRENNRYGVVREMVSPQDEINKRRSKALHILNTAQVIEEDGSVRDEERARREVVKPDGWIKLNPGMADKFRIETRTDMAAGQFQLLQEAKNEIDLMGPNASMQGDTGDTASGRAIMASQQGGMIQMGDLLDSLRHFDVRVYRQAWMRIRQFWTAPKWVRITDDERNVRFVGLNGMPDPVTGRPGPMVAQLDTDIVIDDAPDTVAPAIEQFNALVELKKVDAENEIPFRVLLEAAPNLRNKDKLLEMVDQRQSQAAQMQQGPPPEVQVMMAKAETEAQIAQQRAAAEAERKQQELQVEMALAEQRAAKEIEIERMKAVAKVRLERDVAMIRAANEPPPEQRERSLQ